MRGQKPMWLYDWNQRSGFIKLSALALTSGVDGVQTLMLIETLLSGHLRLSTTWLQQCNIGIKWGQFFVYCFHSVSCCLSSLNGFLFSQHCVCVKRCLLGLDFTWSFSSPSITPRSAGHQALHTCSFHHVIFSLMETLTKAHAPTVQSVHAAAIKACKSSQSTVILRKIQRDTMAFVHLQ